MVRSTITPRRESADKRHLRAGISLSALYVGVVLGACLIAATAGAHPPSPPAQSAATGTESKPPANLLQVMRGIMFPESNVMFAGQKDVAKIPRAEEPALSPDLLTSVFGGWEAVENSALALSETAVVLNVPGRTCANGTPVPVNDANWIKFVNRLRETSLEAYKSAQKKSTDDMVDAASDVSDACQMCHNYYRSNRASFAGRCAPPPPPAPSANQPAAKP